MYKIKKNKVLLKAVFLILLWTCPHPVLAGVERPQDAPPETIKLQTDGIIVQIPLDFSVIGKAALFEIAASFAAMLPATMQYSGCHRLAQASHAMGQRLATLFPYLNGVYLYSLLHPLITDTLFPRIGLTDVIPPVPVSTITSLAKPRHQPCPQIYLSSAFGFEKNLSGGLSALLGYLAEFSGYNTTLNQPQFSFDKVASFSVLQNEGDHVRLSASILDDKNTTHNFWLGRQKEMFWIERLNQQDMTPAMRVAWSVSPSYKQMAKLSVQFPAPAELVQSGIPLEINIPAWLPRHLLASGAKGSLSAFCKQVLNWQLPHRLSRILLKNQKAGGRALNNLIESKPLGRNADYWAGKETVLQPVTALMLHYPKSVPTEAGGRENNQVSNPSSSFHQTSGRKGGPKRVGWEDQQENDGDKEGNGDDGSKTPSSPLPVAKASLQEEKSLLRQATETFYSYHPYPVMEQEEAYRLIAGLSSVGMVQVLPVDLVPMDQWPLVMSRTLADFLKQHLKIDAGIFGEPEKDSEYVVRIGQEAFDQIMLHHEKVAKLIEVRKTLYSVIEQALTNYCGTSGYCYFGGEQVRRFIKKYNFGDKELHQDNLPVSLDVDVMTTFTKPEAIVEAVNEALAKSGLTGHTTDSNTSSNKMSFTFFSPKPNVHFNLYSLEFRGEGLESKYLPGLDFAIANRADKDIAEQFLSLQTIIYESISRGCGPTTDCRSKHVDRLLLLNTLFPSATAFNDLRKRLVSHGQSVAVQTSISNDDLNVLKSKLVQKEDEIKQLKSKANEKIKKNKFKVDKLEAGLADSKRENQALKEDLDQTKGNLRSAQEVVKRQGKELLELQNSNKNLEKKYEDKIRQLLLESNNAEKALKSKISKIHQLLDDKKKKFSDKNDKINHAKRAYKEQLSQQEKALDIKRQKIQLLEGRLTNSSLFLWRGRFLKVGLALLATPTFWAFSQDMLRHWHNRGIFSKMCKQLNYDYSRKLCLIIRDMDSNTFEIIKTMDRLTGRHRVVKYNMFLVNIMTGRVSRGHSQEEIDKTRELAARDGLTMLLFHDGHTYWESMNTDKLAQIVLALSRQLTNNTRKLTGTLADYIEGTIAYCGYMPTESWQRECTDRIIERLFTQGYQPEELNNVKINEPDLLSGNRYIAFLPVWNISQTRMSLYNVWPYKLDANGYHILGSSVDSVDFTYYCKTEGKEVNLRFFHWWEWKNIKRGVCYRKQKILVSGVGADVVIWESHYTENQTYLQRAESIDQQGVFVNAW